MKQIAKSLRFKKELFLTGVLATIILGHSVSSAVTSGQFPIGGQTAIIGIKAQGMDGSFDDGPGILYRSMIVPVQNSPMGPGKAIVAGSRVFNWMCAEARQECSFVIQKKERCQVHPFQKKVTCRYTGDEAYRLFQLIISSGREWKFESLDGKILMSSSAEEFRFDYKD